MCKGGLELGGGGGDGVRERDDGFVWFLSFLLREERRKDDGEDVT